jgi:hypothetical protein
MVKLEPVKIFISHSSRDVWVARRIQDDLQRIGTETFLDENDLQTGDIFDKELRQNLRDSDELLMLLSPTAVASPWVLLEIGAAWALDMRLVPIMHGIGINELPSAIDKRQARDLNEISRYYEELKGRIGTGRGSSAADIATPSKAGAVPLASRPLPEGVDPGIGDRVITPTIVPPNIPKPSGKVVNFVDDMAKYLGVSARIIDVEPSDRTVRLDVDGGVYWWAVEWLSWMRTHGLSLAEVLQEPECTTKQTAQELFSAAEPLRTGMRWFTSDSITVWTTSTFSTCRLYQSRAAPLASHPTSRQSETENVPPPTRMVSDSLSTPRGRIVVLPPHDETATARVITPDGSIEALPDGVRTDEEIKAAFNADEVFRLPNRDLYGRAVCLDGPHAGHTCYATRTTSCTVTIAGSRYVVADPSADPMALRYEPE